MGGHVPEDLPYLVRPNARGYAKIFSAVLLVLLLIPVVVWLALNLSPDPPWAGMPWILWISVLCDVGVVSFVWWVAAGGGPRLAMGPDGVWLRSVNWPVQAIFLSWSDIAAVWMSRHSGLCFAPRDPNLLASLGPRATRGARTQHRRHGALLVVPLGRHSDRPTPEVLAALAHFAAGRTYLAL